MGILSMQRVLNYGSFLQAYALKQLLLQNGADEVYFIDIEKGRSLPGYEPGRSIWSKACTAFSFLLKGRLVSQLKDETGQRLHCRPISYIRLRYFTSFSFRYGFYR